MTYAQEFYFEPDPAKSLSTEVVAAIAQAHDEDIIDQKWCLWDDINTDALDMLFQEHVFNMALQFEADASTVTIFADTMGYPVIKIQPHQ